ncbi:MAG: hypothetical protein Q7T46_06665 [Polaromonas sp.]|nr:hypothetical protein [Polaromonas sp.]
MSSRQQDFERVISALTRPLNGQLPRPWMTDMTNPLEASVFIVGKNQAKAFVESRLEHSRHLNGLFNRSGETARSIYNEMTDGKLSPTRANTDAFREILRAVAVTQILETNVVCYSTPMSVDLLTKQHADGASKGTEIFRTLLAFIQPKVIIAHGSGTGRDLSKILGTNLPPPPKVSKAPEPVIVSGMAVFVIPSLAPPEWNKWCGWAPKYLTAVAQKIALL